MQAGSNSASGRMNSVSVLSAVMAQVRRLV
jgi:hypothetical protein